jgi:hypothetical protein
MNSQHCKNEGYGSALVSTRIRIQIQGFDDQNWKILKAEKRNYFSQHLCKSYIRSLHPLKREHPVLQNIKFLNFFIFFVGLFCPPGSGSALPVRIRIQPGINAYQYWPKYR